MAGGHTIVLVQPTNNKSSRTYLDYPSVHHAMDGLCKDFERKLRGLNPTMATITYEITDLYAYIDQMTDMSALVYAPEPNAYIPCNKDWIKKQAYNHLRDQGKRR
ncbi:hypothetical protein ABBQ32_002577 [Trebouxia sp. C0010 RCD-2024]